MMRLQSHHPGHREFQEGPGVTKTPAGGNPIRQTAPGIPGVFESTSSRAEDLSNTRQTTGIINSYQRFQFSLMAAFVSTPELCHMAETRLRISFRFPTDLTNSPAAGLHDRNKSQPFSDRKNFTKSRSLAKRFSFVRLVRAIAGSTSAPPADNTGHWPLVSRIALPRIASSATVL